MSKPESIDPLDQIYGVVITEKVKETFRYRFNFIRGFFLSLLFFQGVPYLLNFAEYYFIGYGKIKEKLNLTSDKEVLALLLPKSIFGWGVACLFVSLFGIVFSFLGSRSPSVVYQRAYVPTTDISSQIDDAGGKSLFQKLFSARYAFFHGMLMQSIFQIGFSQILGNLILQFF